MALNKEDVYKYNYILNQLGKRILPQYFYEVNPQEMIKWQNQICRQSHIIAAYFLDKWLNADILEYNVEFCESIFIDKVTGAKYDHSWVFVQSISDDNDCYICDIARISEHIGFKPWSHNRPDDLISDEELLEQRVSYNWESLLEGKEHYTASSGKEIIKEIENRLKLNRLWI